jgi:hypothetical protein
MQKITMRAVISVFFLSATLLLSCSKDSDSVVSGNAAGANGSLSRFITYNNFLYLVNRNNLLTYDISNPVPVLKKTTEIGFNIETIFEYQGKLFIGSNNAIFIYSLSNPEQPARVSQFNYFIPGRDPVVAIDSVAYSTTRNFNGQGGNLNIVNIKNLDNPVSEGSFFIAEPYGLAVNGNALYVCNGSNGISIFNRSNAYRPVAVMEFTSVNETFYDLIVRGNIMICYVEAGIVLLDISNPFSPVFISRITQ